MQQKTTKEHSYYKTCRKLLFIQTNNNVQNNVYVEPLDRKFLWFAAPENCLDSSKLTGIQLTIYSIIKHFKELETLDPTKTKKRCKFLEKFDWSQSIFSKLERIRMENLLVKIYKISAKHRLDFGNNGLSRKTDSRTIENNIFIESGSTYWFT